MNYIVEKLFPKALYIAHLTRQFTNDEIDLVNRTSLKIIKNTYNIQSVNVDILEESCMKNLKETILKHVNNYKNDIMSVSDNVDFYITQSWINFTKQNEMHHEHYHPNSILSGVLYISTQEGDSISFLKDHHKNTIAFSKPKEYNSFNSDVVNLPVSNGMLVLFPSDITHQVNKKESSGTRISLAFNTFFKGDLNNPIGLQYLKI
jgi:uncharacterized protein (TIGR02466 family)